MIKLNVYLKFYFDRRKFFYFILFIYLYEIVLFYPNFNVYICIKFPSADLNPNSCSLHPTNTYNCKAIIIPRVHSGPT